MFLSADAQRASVNIFQFLLTNGVRDMLHCVTDNRLVWRIVRILHWILPYNVLLFCVLYVRNLMSMQSQKNQWLTLGCYRPTVHFVLSFNKVRGTKWNVQSESASKMINITFIIYVLCVSVFIYAMNLYAYWWSLRTLQAPWLQNYFNAIH